MKGIDISNYNEVISFNAIKNAGYEICYLKATEGLTYNDVKMRQFYNGAKSVGLKVGFYHFMHNNDAVAEAKHFLSAINGLDSDCLYVLDVEASELQESPWDTSNKIVEFCEYLKSQGKQPCIYANPNFWENVIVGNAKNYPLWLAQYSSSPSISSYAGWQYSEHGSVSGVSGDVDMNEFTTNILLNKNNNLNSISNELAEKYRYKEENVVGDKWVAVIQASLNQIKIFDDENKPLICDGVNGKLTKQSYTRFQEVIDVNRTGEWNDECNKALSAINKWYKWMNDNNRWNFNGN